MGKVILCAGKQAKSAYYFQSTGVGIYSIEELCYYLGHFTEHISEELLSPSLAKFIRDELGLPELALKLERLADNHAGIRDVMLAIFSDTNYYDETETSAIISDYDVLNSMTPLQRKKRDADKCLQDGRNRAAMHIYRSIIYGSDANEIDEAEYGNILHNIAIIHARTGEFGTAADEFKEAYSKNGNTESLKQYLYALKLGHRESDFDREIGQLTENRPLIDQIENELYYVTDTEENTLDYHELKKLKELKEKGRIAEYYKAADEMVAHLKNRYRQENG